MATYKVPQDVEAEDKLLGPFTFRQFAYLIIVALAIALAWGLGQIFVGLAIIPLPIILLFGALALPLRKDQPMEIYLAAIVSYYLKPRRRMWDPEGVESMIEISAPKVVEAQLTKDVFGAEAQQRLGYLANIVDSQGWAIRGVAGATGTAMNTDVYLEAQGAEDILDNHTNIAASFDQMMTESTERVREEARERMMQAAQAAPEQLAAPPPTAAPNQLPAPAAPAYQTPIPEPEPVAVPQFNPYPAIHQAVIQPIEPQTTSDTPLSAGIMNLVEDVDNAGHLSVETIAHQANRLNKKAEDSDEVVISLR